MRGIYYNNMYYTTFIVYTTYTHFMVQKSDLFATDWLVLYGRKVIIVFFSDGKTNSFSI